MENGTANPIGDPLHTREVIERMERGLEKPKSHQWQNPAKSQIVTQWKDRDDWLCASVEFGLSARDIVSLSYSWPQPITTTQQVYDMMDRLNLKGLYKRRERKRIGDHSRHINDSFVKVAGQILECQQPVFDVFRERSPIEGVRFQPDWGLRFGSNRRIFAEVQTSKITHTNWNEKHRNYVRLLRELDEPFRVLFLIDRVSDMAIIRSAGRRVLKDSPERHLFYYMTIGHFRSERDIVTAPVWESCWGIEGQRGGQKFALL